LKPVLVLEAIQEVKEAFQPEGAANSQVEDRRRGKEEDLAARLVHHQESVVVKAAVEVAASLLGLASDSHRLRGSCYTHVH